MDNSYLINLLRFGATKPPADSTGESDTQNLGKSKHTLDIEIKSTIEAEQNLSKNTRDYLALRNDDGNRGAVFYLGDLSLTINGIDYVSWKDWGTYQ